jgi:ribosome-associated protein
MEIRPEDVTFVFSRSSGPGGQNVNKVSSRVTVLLDPDVLPGLSASDKSRLRRRLASRIDREGRIRVVSQRFRTQGANRRAALERLGGLIEQALQQPKPRHRTRPSRSAVERRLRNKKHRGRVKRLRQGDEDAGVQ